MPATHFTGARTLDANGVAILLGETPSLNSYGGVGDGVTDNRVALQALINAVSANGGGIVRIPTGNYALGNYITVPANVWLVGAGPSSVLTRIGTVTAGFGLIMITGSNVRLSDFEIEGSVTTSTVINYGSISTPEDAALTTNSSIWVQPGVSHLRFNRLRIQHTGGYAVFIDVRTANSADIRFNDDDFINNRPHTFTDGTNTGGSWTGGVYVAGESISGAPYALNGLRVRHCHWKRNTGNCFWQHSYGFVVHNTMFRVSESTFEDCGLDAIEFGNVLGGGVSNCDFHRIGYVTATDTDTPTPAYVTGHGAVAIDSTGYVSGVTHAGNTIINPNGFGFNLDGVRDSTITSNTIMISPSTDAQYTTDSVSLMGILVTGVLKQVSKGIETGNSNQNGAAQNLTISNNRISGMGLIGISLPFAKFCHVSGNSINHPSTALGVPIELLGVAGSSPADEWMCHNNVVTGNPINYAGANYCIAEVGAAGLCTANDITGNAIIQ